MKHVVLWSEDEDARLMSLHGSVSIADLAAEMGRTKGSIKGRITTLGIAKRTLWTAAEEAELVARYTDAGANGVVNLTELAATLGRDKANVCRKAKSLGLETNPTRKLVEERKVRPRQFATLEEAHANRGVQTKARIAAMGHPRGMLGKKHSQETIEVISAASSARWAALTEDEQSAQVLKAMKTTVERHGGMARNGGRGSWKAGWREIGGKRNYYRSRWEANYARYLEWLKVGGHIADWKHEPETFWFEAIKRGVRSYLPDFRVWENDGTSALHEVKGWMDSRSRTTLSRMAKYHPQEKLILIDGKQYRSIRLKVMRLIPEWEDAARDGRE